MSLEYQVPKFSELKFKCFIKLKHVKQWNDVFLRVTSVNYTSHLADNCQMYDSLQPYQPNTHLLYTSCEHLYHFYLISQYINLPYTGPTLLYSTYISPMASFILKECSVASGHIDLDFQFNTSLLHVTVLPCANKNPLPTPLVTNLETICHVLWVYLIFE